MANPTKIETEIKNIKSTVDAKTKRKEDLLKQYHEEREKVFTANACAYCGQALPAEKVEELEKHFNAHKVEILGKITAEGKQLASEIENLIKSGTSKEEEIKSLKEEIVKLSVKYQNKLVEYDRVNNELEINPNQDKIDELVARMHQTQEQLNALKMGYVVNPYEPEERQLNDLMGELHMNMAKLNQKVETESRIETLKTQVDSYKKQLAEAEKMLILIDKFNLKKVELQEQGINGQFELVKFKLFDIQINGGINPVCVATVNGVPYPDLNNAMKINAGLDIIRSLQKIYNVKAPIFVDNAESVNKLIDLDDTQFVKLYVTEDDQIKMYVEE